MYFSPQDRLYSPSVARVRARQALQSAIASFGEEHPAVTAARGRVAFHEGKTPQKNAMGYDAIAWRRESGAALGFWNRSERKYRTKEFSP